MINYTLPKELSISTKRVKTVKVKRKLLVWRQCWGNIMKDGKVGNLEIKTGKDTL